MSIVEDRLTALGISIPEVVPPVASYVPAVRTGNLVFTSGQLPFVSGELIAAGLLGKDVDEETASKCAAQCAVNAIAAIKSVIKGASDLFIKAFGDAGKHARSADGVASLPLNPPVEVEVIVEVRD